MLGDPITDLTIAMEVNYFRQPRRILRAGVMKIPGSELRWRAARRRAHGDRFHRRNQGRIRNTIQNIAISGYQVERRNRRRAGQASIEYDTVTPLLPELTPSKCWLAMTKPGA